MWQLCQPLKGSWQLDFKNKRIWHVLLFVDMWVWLPQKWVWRESWREWTRTKVQCQSSLQHCLQQSRHGKQPKCPSTVCACVLSHFSHVWLFSTPWTVAPLCPWDSLGKNSGVGCCALFQWYSRPIDQTFVSYISCIGRQVLYLLHYLEAHGVL